MEVGVGVAGGVGAGEEQADTTTRATSPRRVRKIVRCLGSKANDVVLKVMSDISLPRLLRSFAHYNLSYRVCRRMPPKLPDGRA